MINEQYEQSELTGRIIGCAMKVHREIGCGFPEVVYQRCLEIEMGAADLAFRREVTMPLFYKGIEVGSRRVDFLVDDLVPVELKAVAAITDAHIAQTLNYLTAYQLRVALLINFGESSLVFKRLVNSRIPAPLRPQ